MTNGKNKPKNRQLASKRSQAAKPPAKQSASKWPDAERQIDVRKVIHIDMVSKGPRDGWVHTHGMMTLGLPELEIRQVPQFLMRAAAELLNNVAEYMVHSKRPVKLGEYMQVDGYGMFRFSKLAPVALNMDHYVWERWAIVDVHQQCEYCGPKCEFCRSKGRLG